MVCLLQSTCPRLPCHVPSSGVQPGGAQQEQSEGWRRERPGCPVRLALSWLGSDSGPPAGQPLPGLTVSRPPRVRVLTVFPFQTWCVGRPAVTSAGFTFQLFQYLCDQFAPRSSQDAVFLTGKQSESCDRPRQHIKKQRHRFADKGLSSQSYGLSSCHVWM